MLIGKGLVFFAHLYLHFFRVFSSIFAHGYRVLRIQIQIIFEHIIDKRKADKTTLSLTGLEINGTSHSPAPVI